MIRSVRIWPLLRQNVYADEMDADLLPYQRTRPPGARCCDNCEPKGSFPVEEVEVTDTMLLKRGRRKKSSAEIQIHARQILKDLRDAIVKRDWPNQLYFTGRDFMSDAVLESIASGASFMVGMDDILTRVRWARLGRYGSEVLQALRPLTDADTAEVISSTAIDGITSGLAAAAVPASFLHDKELREHMRTIYKDVLDSIEALTDADDRPRVEQFKVVPRVCTHSIIR